MARLWIFAATVLFFSIRSGWATESESPPAPAWTSSMTQGPASEGTTVSKKSPKHKKRRGASPGEKDTEGTEALDRFEADTVIKSKYKLDGQSLEVDPD